MGRKCGLSECLMGRGKLWLMPMRSLVSLQGVKWKTLQLGEVVDANRMASTPYLLNFRTERKDEAVCTKALTNDELATFRKVRMGTC